MTCSLLPLPHPLRGWAPSHMVSVGRPAYYMPCTVKVIWDISMDSYLLFCRIRKIRIVFYDNICVLLIPYYLRTYMYLCSLHTDFVVLIIKSKINCNIYTTIVKKQAPFSYLVFYTLILHLKITTQAQKRNCCVIA